MFCLSVFVFFFGEELFFWKTASPIFIAAQFVILNIFSTMKRYTKSISTIFIVVSLFSKYYGPGFKCDFGKRDT